MNELNLNGNENCSSSSSIWISNSSPNHDIIAERILNNKTIQSLFIPADGDKLYERFIANDNEEIEALIDFINIEEDKELDGKFPTQKMAQEERKELQFLCLSKELYSCFDLKKYNQTTTTNNPFPYEPSWSLFNKEYGTLKSSLSNYTIGPQIILDVMNDDVLQQFNEFVND